MPKGQSYDSEKAYFSPTNSFNKSIDDYFRIYPDSSANIPSSRISSDGYLTGVLDDYYNFSFSNGLIGIGSTGLLSVSEKKEGVCTITVIEKTTGRSCKIDFQTKFIK